MKNLLLSMVILSCTSMVGFAQVTALKFGDGIFNIMAVDSSFTMKFGIRFQNLMISTSTNDGESFLNNTKTNFLVRRARFKFHGFAYSPRLTYKFEVGLSNRDQSGGNTSDYGNAPRYIFDAWVMYQLSNHWAVKFGQGKLAGNRERVISSSNLQFVDRSELNFRFNIDRDFGVHIIHTSKLGDGMHTKFIASISQGEGRNITSGNRGGLDYTVRGEILPFGKFASKGDYINSSIVREPSPKLSIGISYNLNQRAGKNRGQNGDFINVNDEGLLKDLNTVFADFMYKYQAWSFLGEYAHKKTGDDDPVVTEEGNIIGTYYTGSAFSIQGGYMFDSNYELAMRYTTVDPDEVVDVDEVQYTIGFNKFIVDHKLKLQTDLTYRDRDESSDELVYRLQMDLHF